MLAKMCAGLLSLCIFTWGPKWRSNCLSGGGVVGRWVWAAGGVVVSGCSWMVRFARSASVELLATSMSDGVGVSVRPRSEGLVLAVSSSASCGLAYMLTSMVDLIGRSWS